MPHDRMHVNLDSPAKDAARADERMRLNPAAISDQRALFDDAVGTDLNIETDLYTFMNHGCRVNAQSRLLNPVPNSTLGSGDGFFTIRRPNLQRLRYRLHILPNPQPCGSNPVEVIFCGIGIQKAVTIQNVPECQIRSMVDFEVTHLQILKTGIGSWKLN